MEDQTNLKLVKLVGENNTQARLESIVLHSELLLLKTFNQQIIASALVFSLEINKKVGGLFICSVVLVFWCFAGVLDTRGKRVLRNPCSAFLASHLA